MEYFIALTKIHRYIPESDLAALSHLIQNSMYSQICLNDHLHKTTSAESAQANFYTIVTV